MTYLDRSFFADAPAGWMRLARQRAKNGAQCASAWLAQRGYVSLAHDDADSGLFSLFNYPASPPSPPPLGINVAVADVVTVFSLSLAERTESPARGAITIYLREHTSWGRNRKYRRTIMAISRKNRRIPYGTFFPEFLFFNTPTSEARLDFISYFLKEKRQIQRDLASRNSS